MIEVFCKYAERDRQAKTIGFDGDLYGKYVEVDPVQKVSELEWFETTEEIIKKIDQDIVLVKEVLALK